MGEAAALANASARMATLGTTARTMTTPATPLPAKTAAAACSVPGTATFRGHPFEWDAAGEPNGGGGFVQVRLPTRVLRAAVLDPLE